jgi:hypothetical protein
MVTTLSRDEIKADLEQAERLGVFVLARQEIEQLVTGTLTPVNADTMFETAEQRTRDAQENLNLKRGSPEYKAT